MDLPLLGSNPNHEGAYSTSTQADRVLSTPPTNTPVVSSRRGFLGGTAAALAAGTAVNVAALATFRPANAASDPIYAAIEAHKAAAAVAVAAVKRNSDLENELYDNKRLQRKGVWRTKVRGRQKLTPRSRRRTTSSRWGGL